MQILEPDKMQTKHTSNDLSKIETERGRAAREKAVEEFRMKK